MRTLNISISDSEFNRFRLTNENLSFKELIALLNKELTKQNLLKCLELAKSNGLDQLNLEDIDKEIKEVRKNAKGRN
jgi:predicted CopG family antitoxin